MGSDDKNEGCAEVLALLSDYLNLDLPPEACREIEHHLDGCTPCEEFAESLRSTVDLCRQYRPEELPSPIGDEARQKLLAAYGKMLAGRKAGIA
jgi:RNA polymerase sigma-70 factor (ECF subfamily)